MRKIYELLRIVKETQKPGSTRADDHDAHIYMGNMYLSLGHTKRAEAEFEAALALRPSEQIRKHLAMIRNGWGLKAPSTGQPSLSSRAA